MILWGSPPSFVNWLPGRQNLCKTNNCIILLKGWLLGTFACWQILSEPCLYLQACSEYEQPLEGAKARLEELKESLYQRERELTELLETERSPIPQPPCSVLLPIVIHKVLFKK